MCGKFDVIGLGMSCVDCVLKVEDTANLSRGKVLDWTIQGGGKASTAMVAAARLGARVSIMTRVGQDEAGELIISEFKKYGVDTSRIIVQEGYSTPILFILVDAYGNPRWVNAETLKNWVLPEPVGHMVKLAEGKKWAENIITRRYTDYELDSIVEGRILLLDCFQPECLSAAIVARKNNVETCLDMYFHQKLADLLRNITYCIPSRRTAASFTGETDPEAMCRKILSLGPEVVGVTLGEEGSVFVSKKGEVVRQKAFKVQAVDTTGAGDVFHGAFCFGVLQGWSLPKIVEFSSAVAALKCRRLGGRAGIPSLREVEEYMSLNKT
ncbi:MAG: PfkB family carbohydrate kinase [Thermoproteota archaeon]